MSGKAKVFDDTVTRRDSIAFSDTAQQKHLEPLIFNLHHGLWERHCQNIVCNCNVAKFWILPLPPQLLDTDDKFLAEASPHDLVWGIGFWADEW